MDTLTLPTPEPPLPAEACAALVALADNVHDDDVGRIARMMGRGEYVAMLAPAGFRLSLAGRALAELLAGRKDLVAFRVTPLTIAESLDDWLDHLLRELSTRVGGLSISGRGNRLLALLYRSRTRRSADLSPVRASMQTVLGPVIVPAETSPEVRAVVDAVGGHPELVRWAANRGGRTGGRPEDELPLLREQVTRFREGLYREQLQRLLIGESAAWKDPDPALRWSGWLRLTDPAGWLGPVLEGVARRTVGA
ncbi:MAG: hypothetical protein IPK67_19330 [Planctomycetes bacterium]|nr:hypothetical protein [Planctomycetota bacterium]